MKRFLTILMIVAILGGCFAAACAETDNPYADLEPVTIRLLCTALEDETWGVYVGKFTDRITEESGGKINFKITYAASTIFAGESEVFDMLRSGSCDIANFALTQMNGFVPEVEVTCWPYVFDSSEHVMNFFSSDASAVLVNKMEETSGLKYITAMYGGMRNLTTNGVEVRKPEDLAGLKIRCMNDNIYVSGMNAMGATAVPIAYGELYFSLQTGVIDGQENSGSVMVSGKLYEVQDTLNLTHHLSLPNSVFANNDFWAKLPQAYQDLILKVYHEGAQQYADEIDAIDDAYNEQCVQEGMKLVEDVDYEAFIEKTKAVFMDTYADRPEFIELYNAIRAAA